jgi:prepilin-type N-terminal cleavage/methylation domain-containing protein/prepilin-type processing-associated H-X9-DG protein
MSRNLRKAFTLTELLVVITIIGILVGLIMPAVVSARKSAQRLDCANRLRELTMATVRYESSKQQYPGYIQALYKTGTIYSTTPNHIVVPWSVMILPELNRNDLWMDFRTPAATPAVCTGTTMVLNSFVCPSDPKAATLQCPMSYVANCGVQDSEVNTYPPDRAANGIFQNLYAFRNLTTGTELTTLPAIASSRLVRVAASDIRDGAEYTILLSENLQTWQWTYGLQASIPNNYPESLFGMVWWPPSAFSSNYNNSPRLINTDRNLADAAQYAASSQYYWFARPSSNHDNGVNVSFCDGHVSFMRENIAYPVFAQLMSPDCRRVVNPGTEKVFSPTLSSGYTAPIPAGTF